MLADVSHNEHRLKKEALRCVEDAADIVARRRTVGGGAHAGLDPAAAKAQRVGRQVHVGHGNRAVFDPRVGDGRVPEHGNDQARRVEELLFGIASLGKAGNCLRILDDDEAPGLLPFPRRAGHARDEKRLDRLAGNASSCKATDAATVKQRIENFHEVPFFPCGSLRARAFP